MTVSVIDVFRADVSMSEIAASLETDGGVCMYGMRSTVREVLKRVCEYLNKGLEGESQYTFLSYDHPNTEIGYAFNMDQYPEIEVIKEIAINSYEKSVQNISLIT